MKADIRRKFNLQGVYFEIMKVAIGSENPVKIECVKLAFQAAWPDKTFEFVSYKTDSGVSAQPMSDAESIKGAIARAQQALSGHDADYGVGLEGGLQKIGEIYYDSGWIVIIDRQHRRGIGSTAKFPIPEKCMKMILDGKELGDAIDILFKEDNMKQKRGFFGGMTNNLITRTSAYKDAVIVALSRFLHPELFE